MRHLLYMYLFILSCLTMIVGCTGERSGAGPTWLMWVIIIIVVFWILGSVIPSVIGTILQLVIIPIGIVVGLIDIIKDKNKKITTKIKEVSLIVGIFILIIIGLFILITSVCIRTTDGESLLSHWLRGDGLKLTSVSTQEQKDIDTVGIGIIIDSTKQKIDSIFKTKWECIIGTKEHLTFINTQNMQRMGKYQIKITVCLPFMNQNEINETIEEAKRKNMYTPEWDSLGFIVITLWVNTKTQKEAFEKITYFTSDGAMINEHTAPKIIFDRTLEKNTAKQLYRFVDQ